MQKMLRTVYLVRHGETDWNAHGRWQGQTDVLLNARGRSQSLEVAQALRGLPIAGIVASDLARARETALIVADALGMTLAYVDAALRERSFGCFEGLTRLECEQRHAKAWRLWLAERIPPPGAEDQIALAERVTGAVVKVAEQIARDTEAAVIVSHSGAIRAFVRAATGSMPPPVANGEVCPITWDGHKFAIPDERRAPSGLHRSAIESAAERRRLRLDDGRDASRDGDGAPALSAFEDLLKEAKDEQ